MRTPSELGAALLYCRGATMYSIWAQQEVCAERAGALGYSVGQMIVEFVDGRGDGRKLPMVRELIRSGRFAALVVSEPPVLTGDRQTLDAIRAECRQAGARLAFVHDDTPPA